MSDDRINQQNLTSQSPTVATRKPEAFITEPKQLADQKVYEEFKDIIDKIVDFNNREDALKARILLEDILLPKYPELANDAPVLFVKYQQLIMLLKFLVLSSRPMKEVEELIGSHLIDAIKAKLPIRGILQDILDAHNDIAMEGEIAEFLAKAMLASESRIGAGLTSLSNKTIPGSIKNWLLDYNARTHKSATALDDRGAVERISYINQNQSSRNLSEADRKLLLVILEIYDWLRYGTAFEEVQREITELVRTMPTAPIAPVPHGTPLEEFKAKMQADKIKFSPPPVAPLKPVIPPAMVRMTPAEIKREVATRELPESVRNAELVSASQKKDPELNSGLRPKTTVPSVTQIQTIDDLKKLELSYLRQGNLQTQISNLKSIISNLARANNVLPYYVVNSLEQSPLFKSYMAHGNSKVTGLGAAGDMSQVEFEAMADLRKEIERL